MTKEEFTKLVWDNVATSPKSWRKGQAVFNVIDELFGVARIVQFADKIDCFYNDEAIDKFIDASWDRINILLTTKENEGEV